MRKISFLLLLAAIGLQSCDFVGGKRVRGNGNVQTENRMASNFTGVSSFGSFDVYITQGSAYSIKVEAEDNLLPYIETEAEGGVLKIKTRNGYSIRTRKDIKVYISAPAYSMLSNFGSGNIISQGKLNSTSAMDVELTGSGDIRLDVNTPAISADITGSGVITLNGETKDFKGGIMGSGDIKAGDLKAENADVEIMGSGSVEIYASVKVSADIRGSGDVRYRGPANVSSDVSGSGTVKKVGE